MISPYKFSVGSANDYDNLIAEVKFGSALGLIVSKEPRDGEFMVSVHSFDSDAADDFDYARNVDRHKVSLGSLIAALNEARERLESLG